MKKLFKNKLALIFAGPVVFIVGVGTLTGGVASIVFSVLFIAVGFLACVKALKHLIEKDVKIKP